MKLVTVLLSFIAVVVAYDPLDFVDTRIGTGGFGFGVGGDNPGPQGLLVSSDFRRFCFVFVSFPIYTRPVPYASCRLGPDTSLDTTWFYFTHFGGK